MSDELGLGVLVRNTSSGSFTNETSTDGAINRQIGVENVAEIEHCQQNQPLLLGEEGKQQYLKFSKQRKELHSKAGFADDSLAIVHSVERERAGGRGGQRNAAANLVQTADTSELDEEKDQNNSCCCRSSRGVKEQAPDSKKSGESPETGNSRFRATTTTINQEAQRLWRRSSVDYSACSQSESTNCSIAGHQHNHRHSNEGAPKPGANFRHPSKVNMSTVTRSQTTRLIPAYFIAELVGTFLLVIIGDGAIAAYVLTKHPIDIFCACFAFGVGAMIAGFTSARISGAHINPAASLAFAMNGQLKWRLLPVYILAQYIGGFLAALVLFLNYSEAINAIDGGQHSASGGTNSTGNIFATYPAPYLTIWGSLLDQIVGTAVLLFSISAVTDGANQGLDDKHQPLVVAFVIGIVCVAFSPNCGAIFNPARDLAPRLITAIFGYQSVWAPLHGTYWILTAVVGPHIGAIIGVFAYKYTIGYALEAQRIFYATSSPREQSSSN